ncbi:MAG TPA: serine hydrolase [Acidimicrobiales bacterium]
MVNGRLLGPERGAGGAPSTASGDAPAPPSSGGREVFLDAIRAIAIVRVIAWHAFGVAAITYFVAAMPAMFFVSGSLLAKSMRRRSATAVLTDRFRRLLVPLWAFALVAWAVMAVAAWRAGASLPLDRVAAWLLPLTDPRGTEWEGGWLSTHLWYLRTLTWLLLASPLLLRAVRARRVLTFAVPLVAVFVLDLAARQAVFPFGEGTTWAVGDIALYSVFFLAGVLHRDGAFDPLRRSAWVGLAVAAGLVALAWRLTQPVPLGVVNNSHPMHLFVGAAWLALAMAAQGPLARLATSPLAGAAVRAIGRRSLTIYLWHTAAIILAVNILEASHVEDSLAYNVGLVLLTVLGVLVAVRAFGWIEDFAARRKPATRPSPGATVLPGRIAVGTLAAAAAGILLTAATPPVISSGTVTDTAAAAEPPRTGRRPPVPSKPPPAPVFGDRPAAPAADAGTGQEATANVAAPPLLVPESTDEFVARLDQTFREWAQENRVNGALAGLAIGSELRWTGATGSRPDTGAQVRATDAVDLASLTKLFTSTLVYRAAEAGLVDLFGPLPALDALPDFPYDEGISVLQLLSHTSGLVNYRDTGPYLADPASISDPLSAVRASVAEPRLNAPGYAFNYSSTNFLVLGLLLEQATGRTFDELLYDQFVGPLDLRGTTHRPPAPGEPRGATAGIVTTLPDLLKAGVIILRDHAGLSDFSYALMSAVDPETGFGMGTFGFCPCRYDVEGMPRFAGIGYYGATTLLSYLPGLDMTLAIDLVDSLWEDDQYGPVSDLVDRIERLVQDS